MKILRGVGILLLLLLLWMSAALAGSAFTNIRIDGVPLDQVDYVYFGDEVEITFDPVTSSGVYLLYTGDREEFLRASNSPAFTVYVNKATAFEYGIGAWLSDGSYVYSGDGTRKNCCFSIPVKIGRGSETMTMNVTAPDKKIDGNGQIVIDTMIPYNFEVTGSAQGKVSLLMTYENGMETVEMKEENGCYLLDDDRTDYYPDSFVAVAMDEEGNHSAPVCVRISGDKGNFNYAREISINGEKLTAQISYKGQVAINKTLTVGEECRINFDEVTGAEVYLIALFVEYDDGGYELEDGFGYDHVLTYQEANGWTFRLPEKPAIVDIQVCPIATGYAPGFSFVRLKTVAGGSAKVIEFPDNLQRIESAAFSGSGVEVIDIPASCVYIAPDAFDACPNLKKIINHSDITIQPPEGVILINR